MKSLARTPVLLRLLPAVRLAGLLLAATALAPTLPFVSAAFAAPAGPVPVALPAGQTASDWADALEARGFVVSTAPGLPASGPGVVLVDQKDYWEMIVRDRAGGTQTVNLAPCVSPGEREDLLFYASTLLGPAPVEAPVPVAVGTPAAVVAPAEPVAVKEPVVSALPKASDTGAKAPPREAPLASDTGAKAPPREAPLASDTGAKAPPRDGGAAPTTGAASGVATPPTSGPSTVTKATPAKKAGPGLWVAAGGGVGIRTAAGVVADLRADGGWYLTRDLRVGVGLGARSAAALLAVGDGRTMGDVDLLVEGAWGLPLAPVTPYLGLYTGLGIRSFADNGDPVLTAPVPVLGGEVGATIPLGALPIQLAPSVRVQGDLRSIEVRSDTAGLTPISPVELRAGVQVVYRP